MKVLNENLNEGKDELSTPNIEPSLSSSQNNSNGWLYILKKSMINFVN